MVVLDDDDDGKGKVTEKEEQNQQRERKKNIPSLSGALGKALYHTHMLLFFSYSYFLFVLTARFMASGLLCDLLSWKGGKAKGKKGRKGKG